MNTFTLLEYVVLGLVLAGYVASFYRRRTGLYFWAWLQMVLAGVEAQVRIVRDRNKPVD